MQVIVKKHRMTGSTHHYSMPQVRHKALKQLTAQLARAQHPVSAGDIEEYVQNLWCMDEDPWKYTTD